MKTAKVPNDITSYIHCGLCISERQRSHIGVGFTAEGLQIWCERHDVNIVHIDFQGSQHPAITVTHMEDGE
jgi:hypothetical protein